MEGIKRKTGGYKYKPEFCQSLVNWMAKGKSYITWGPCCKEKPHIATSTMYTWEEKYPEWKSAKLSGYAKGLDFFETLLLSASMRVLPPELKELGSKGVDLTAIIFTLKTRFHKEYGEIQKFDDVSQNKTLQVNFIKPNVDKST